MSNTGASTLRVRKLTYSALFLALAMVLPFLTGQIPQIGSALSPMHIPALLCGFLCGWPWGLAVGFLSPLLRSLIFGMPALMPNAVGMAVELAVYGCASGYLYKKLPRTKPMIYVTLVLAMIAGRLAWGAARLILLGVAGSSFTWAMFLGGAVINAVPGIILHLALIPILVMALEQAGLGLNR